MHDQSCGQMESQQSYKLHKLNAYIQTYIYIITTIIITINNKSIFIIIIIIIIIIVILLCIDMHVSLSTFVKVVSPSMDGIHVRLAARTAVVIQVGAEPVANG